MLPVALPVSGSTRISPRLSLNDPVVVWGNPPSVKLIWVSAESSWMSACRWAEAARAAATVKRTTAKAVRIERRIRLERRKPGERSGEQCPAGQTRDLERHG